MLASGTSTAKLTSRQAKILDFIREVLVASGSAPTQAEIAEHFRYRSLNAVRQHLRLMERKGAVRLNRGKARGIEIPQWGENVHLGTTRAGIPVVGRVAAGSPILAEENVEQYVDIPSCFGNRGRLFALRVRGDSMVDAGILDGDLVVLEKRCTVENGEIAVVRLDHEATLKRVCRTCDGVVLSSANPAFEDIVINGGDGRTVSIEGRYVGLLRVTGTHPGGKADR